MVIKIVKLNQTELKSLWNGLKKIKSSHHILSPSPLLHHHNENTHCGNIFKQTVFIP